MIPHSFHSAFNPLRLEYKLYKKESKAYDGRSEMPVSAGVALTAGHGHNDVSCCRWYTHIFYILLENNMDGVGR